MIDPFSVKEVITLLTVLSGTPDLVDISVRVVATPSHMILYTFNSGFRKIGGGFFQLSDPCIE
ncbi:MAG: hypothetical protein FWD37_03390 [Methanomassiliicoccaceae archaeon]|nr:hypothetical protein [Methanomassiliicoccaceae archaeon]